MTPTAMSDNEFRDFYRDLDRLRRKLDQPIPVYLEEQLPGNRHRSRAAAERFCQAAAQPRSLAGLLAGEEETTGMLFVVLWREKLCLRRPELLETPFSMPHRERPPELPAPATGGGPE